MILNGNEILINNLILAFIPLVTSSPLTKITSSITQVYTQVLHEENFLTIDTQISVIESVDHEICRKMLRNWSEKLEGEISLIYTWLLWSKNFPTWWCFLKNSWTGGKHRRRSTTAAKREGKEKKERQKLKKKQLKSQRLSQGHFFIKKLAQVVNELRWLTSQGII